MYYFLYGIVKFFSLLPLPVLYFFSDVVYVVVYYIKGYRKKVVKKNLQIAFPEKSEKERTRIAKDFYHGLVDTFIETIKFFSWDIEKMNRRFSGSMKDIESLYHTGRPIHLLGMHNFNWEFANWWAAARAAIPFYGIYLPIGNKHFDRMMKKMRSRYGTILVPATDFRNQYEAVRNSQHLLGTVADQSPADPRNAWWLDFFERKTAFIRGAERGAIAARAGVVFIHFYRAKRGYYELTTKLVTDDASKFSPGELTLAYARFVEESIRKYPAGYLWSHRRWKHEWKEEYAGLALT